MVKHYLGFNIVLLIILLFISPSCSKQKSPLPLSVPQNVDWLMVNESDIKKKSYSLFIAQGNRYYREFRNNDGQTLTFIFDGINFYCSNAKLKSYKIDFDERKSYEHIYPFLVKYEYKGIKNVNNYKCWYFVIKEKDEMVSQIWIDIANDTPRQLKLFGNDNTFIYNLPSSLIMPDNIFSDDGLYNNLLDKIDLSKY